MHIIECKNVSSSITGPKGEPRFILEGITFDINEGEIFTIIGPSGSGKTSLLRLLNRLDEPASGEVIFKGKPIVDLPPSELRRHIAMAFQRPKLFGPNVIDDLLYPFKIDQKPPDIAELRDRGRHLLTQVGLDPGFSEREVARLSGGETMRVAIARALMRQPDVLLLDEPTAGLDPDAAGSLLETIIELNRGIGLTIVAVTHRFAYARLIGHRTMLLERGCIVEIGQTSEFFSGPRTEIARAFIGSQG